MDDLLTVAQAAEILEVKEQTMRQYIYIGMIKSERVGVHRFVRRSEIDRYKKDKIKFLEKGGFRIMSSSNNKKKGGSK